MSARCSSVFERKPPRRIPTPFATSCIRGSPDLLVVRRLFEFCQKTEPVHLQPDGLVEGMGTLAAESARENEFVATRIAALLSCMLHQSLRYAGPLVLRGDGDIFDHAGRRPRFARLSMISKA